MKPVRLFALAFAALLGAGAADAQIAFRAASQAAIAAAATPAFVASATNTVDSGSMAINRPAGAAQDDVLIAQVTVKGVQTLRASNKMKVNSVQSLPCSCFGEGTWRANWSMMNCGT